jgi:O-antigen/teichoic acid export membrane protein
MSDDARGGAGPQLQEPVTQTLAVAYVSTLSAQAASQAFYLLLFGWLTVADVGVFSWAVAAATIYAYTADLGFNTFLVGELSARRYRLITVARAVLALRLPAFALGAVLLAIWSVVAGPSPREVHTVSLVSGAYMVQLLESSAAYWLQVRQRQNLVNGLGVVTPVGRVVGLLLCWGRPLELSYVVSLVLATQLLGSSLIVGCALVDARRDVAAPDGAAGIWDLLGAFRRRGPKLALLYGLMALQSRLDWLIVSSMLSKTALASYAVANKLLESALLLAGVAARTAFPWLSHRDADDAVIRRKLERLRQGFAAGSALICCVLYFWAPTVLRLFFGDRYIDAETPARILSLGGAVFMLNQYYLYVLLAGHLERQYIPWLAVATGLQVLTDVALIPSLGIRAAAFGMIAMGIVVLIAQLTLAAKHGKLDRREVLELQGFIILQVAVVALSGWFVPNRVLATGLACGGIVILAAALLHRRDLRRGVAPGFATSRQRRLP